MAEQLSKLEIGKDTVQSAVEAMASTANEVTGIVTSAVGDVARSLGGLATELFELRDAARKASGEDDI
ncbi:MAG TPA: hypothetical protein VGE38_02480 [Nocardioides sp.]|uniref:hypothetical protein n=1 Tax=Nocardioides sp. TaxID=35761 RepID=UPI002EDA628D